MKTINSKLSDVQAYKELRGCSIISMIAGLVGLIIFWWLGILALGFGVRGVVLSRHPGNRTVSKKYLIFSIIGLLTGLADVILYISFHA